MRARKIPVIVEAQQLTTRMTIGDPLHAQTGSPGDWIIFEGTLDPYLLSEPVFSSLFEPISNDLPLGVINKPNTWKIPYSNRKDNRLYGRALRLCHRFNKPFPEALELLKAAGEKFNESEDAVPDEQPAAVKENPVTTGTFVSTGTEQVSTLETIPDKSITIVPGTNPVVEKTPGKEANFGITTYTDEQKKLIWGSPDTDAAVTNFEREFPTEKRTVAGIKYQWYTRPEQYRKADKSQSDSNKITIPEESTEKSVVSNTLVKWTPEEGILVSKYKDRDEAVKAYKKAFPDSTRSESAIKQFHKKQTQKSHKESREALPIKPAPLTTKLTAQPDKAGAILDANGKPLFVGAKVTQILANGSSRAFGVGTVTEFPDGNVKARFPNSTKVLPGKHFELYQPEASAEAMSK